jgi:Rrf2 family protein
MISKTGLLAIDAMTVLAGWPRERYAAAGAIAESIDAPQNYLSKLLHGMARAGLVQSQKGRRGGFRLARSPESISLLEVIRCIETKERWTGCLLGREDCTDGHDPCAVHARWCELRDGYRRLLEETTIADLTRGGGLPVDVGAPGRTADPTHQLTVGSFNSEPH